MKNCLRVFFQKFITKDWIWVLFDCTINRTSEYATIQRNEVLKNRVDLLVSKHGVLDGPFSGMRYLKRAHGSVLLPKLLGSYESEIHSIVQEIIHKPPQVIIDIGCAEGYYAVGFALKIPKSRVLAFDTAEEARELTSKLALVNTVSDRVEIYGEFCVENVLPEILGKTCFILCDIDGAENAIFQAETAGFLKDCRILVETHDGYVEGVTQKLLNIFRATHDAQVIDSNCDYEIKSLTYRTLAFRETNRVLRGRFFEEGRPFPQKWIYFTPRQNS
jgi:hypothetical protein